ncbi:MAG: hypothetical protein FJ100_08275 [Deltaproteobacteria bacterium]|nr:hypothetical protein [Deltaproteobacteria bacterium]
MEPPAFALPALDRATFDVDAGPLLATRCGDALCHGRADRPFVVYSVGRHRLDPAKTFLSSPLDPTERDRNFASTLGFVDHPTPHRTTLVRKALGQMGHKGGAVFEAPSDPPLQALAAWMSGEAARRSPP